MPFFKDLPRRWITIKLPSVGHPGRLHATYESFAEFPPAPADVGRLDWLGDAQEWESSALAAASNDAVTDLALTTLTARLAEGAPPDLLDFIGNPDLRRRLPSATEAYFDLGDEICAVEGGRLLHLVSDSQWVMHWSVYIGDDGQTGIVASDFPVGFHLDEADTEYWSGVSSHYFLCALTFGEFAWRWWMDNEIFYHSKVDKLPLTIAQQTYLDGYGEPSSLQ